MQELKRIINYKRIILLLIAVTVNVVFFLYDNKPVMDEDIIKTIETFMKLDLNLSEAAKQLYVHRNTLIYRLDKIQKYTGCDIRKFNDACLFKIAFYVWKQKINTNKNLSLIHI